MSEHTNLKPGQDTPASGQYQEVHADGSRGREITSIAGKPLPPTTQADATYILVDGTDNESGRQ